MNLRISTLILTTSILINLWGRFFIKEAPKLSTGVMSFLTTLVFICALETLYSLLSSISKNATELFKVFLTLFIGLILFVNMVVVQNFHEYLTYEMLFYLKSDISSIIDLTKTYLLRPMSIFGLLGILIGNYLAFRETKPYSNKLNGRSKVLTFIIFFSLIGMGWSLINRLTWKEDYSSTDYLSSTLVALKRGLSQINKNSFLYSSIRTNPPIEYKEKRQREIKDNYNIILIYHESWGKSTLSPHIMPHYFDFIKRNQENVIQFRKAYTASTATDLSVPSLLTGLYSTRSSKDFHQVPLLWQWTKALGLNSLLVSSQRFKWAKFDQFFLSSPPDQFITAENSNSPVIHDIGIDDHISTQLFNKNMALIKSPFLGIFNSNGMHAPFQQESEFVTAPSNLTPYEKSAYIVDHAMGQLYSFLRRNHLLENTFIFFTSDHGEKDPVANELARINSPHEDFINIPFSLYIPKNWEQQHPGLFKNLKENRTKNISNVDILPTIIDILHPDLDLNLKDDRTVILDGISLLNKIDHQRMIKVSTINDFRDWNKKAFSIIKGNYRLNFSSTKGLRLFNVEDDPLLLNPLKKTNDPNYDKIFQSLYQIAQQDPIFSQLLKQVK